MKITLDRHTAARRFDRFPGLRLTSRMVMVLMVISVRCGYWFVEQPGSSQLIHNPELKYLLSLLSDDKVIDCELTRLPVSEIRFSMFDTLPWCHSVGWAIGVERVLSQAWRLEIGRSPSTTLHFRHAVHDGFTLFGVLSRWIWVFSRVSHADSRVSTC